MLSSVISLVPPISAGRPSGPCRGGQRCSVRLAPPRASAKVGEELGKMLTTGYLADVSVTVDAKAFKANSFVLQARCPRLKTRCERTSPSFQPRVICEEIPKLGLDVVSFEHLLVFIYTGDVSDECPQANLKTITEAANELQMDLSELDAKWLGLLPLRNETVVEEMLWARRLGLLQLLASRKDYYLANTGAVLAATPDGVKDLAASGFADLITDLYVAALQRGTPAMGVAGNEGLAA